MSHNNFDILEKVTEVTGKGKEKVSKCPSTIKFVLAVIGLLAAAGGIIYTVYRFTHQHYLEEFEDNLDGEDEDDEEDDFEEEDEEEEDGHEEEDDRF